MSGAELSFVPEYQGYFAQPAGKEHYRLLEQLVEGRRGVVVDVGTLYGASALALASNPSVDVWTYDIVNHIPDDAPIKSVPNISFRLKNGIEAIPDFVDSTDLIILDIDPHDGIQEAAFFESLQRHGYQGTVVCDDIHLNPAMERFWTSLSVGEKRDATSEGHWSGTGIVVMK